MSWFDDNLPPGLLNGEGRDALGQPAIVNGSVPPGGFYTGPQIGAPGTNTGITGGALSLDPGGVQPQMQAADPQAIIAQWQQSHPASAPDIPGLVKALQAAGINAQHATHAGGQISEDKFTINGGMYDVGSSLGAPDGKWFSNPQPDLNDPNAGGQGGFAPGGGAISRLYNPTDLTAGWTDEFKAPTADEAMNSPGIQAALRLGQQAIERSAASKGTLLTGGTLKDLTSFANDVGSQAYGDVYSRAKGEFADARNTFFQNQSNLFDRNFSLADLGARTAGANATAQQNNANQQTAGFDAQGNAASAGTVAGTNAWMPTIGALTNLGVDATTRNRTSY